MDKYPIGEYHRAKNEKGPGVLDQPRGLYFFGHVLDRLPNLVKAYGGKVQLIYMDPPFMTGQSFRYRQKLKGKNIIEYRAYSDQWKGGKGDYLGFMKEVFGYAYRLLSPEGSLYVHVDYRTSAYLRVILDEIFGDDNFLNEIIWHYQSGGRAKRHFSRKHDTILFYRKSKEHYFDIEAVGLKRGNKKRNNMKREVDEAGRVFWSIKSAGKIYRYYEDSMVYPSDVWSDISHLHQRDPERTGYDTQKPEALLRRIMLSSSRPGDWVADLFAGSGTTLSMASKLGRNWIGIDSSPHSMHVCRKRLIAQSDREDFLIRYGKDRGAFYKPGIDLVDAKVTGGLRTIKILDYRPPKDILLSVKEDKKTPLKGLDYIDYWAVGDIKEGVFCPLAKVTGRDRDRGIENTLSIKESIDRVLIIHIVDIWGNQCFIRSAAGQSVKLKGCPSC